MEEQTPPTPLDWTFLSLEDPAPGWHQMALDQAMLSFAGRHGVGMVRLYRWAPPCLSFGRHEPATRRYDRAKIHALALDAVRRPTGGRAVWHDGELTYAVAAPCLAFGSLPLAYRRIHRMLAGALVALGVPATLAPAPLRTPGVASGACFAAPVGGEVVVEGGKVVGSAQVREGDVFLQHGSILIEDDQSVVAGITAGPAPPGAAAPLGPLTGGRVGYAEVAHAVAAAVLSWPGAWQDAAVSSELAELAGEAATRFRSPEWTWRR